MEGFGNFIFGLIIACIVFLMTGTANKDRTFESPKPITPELVIKQVDGKSDTTYIYHHPSYFNR